MREEELRALVRDAVARHLGRGPEPHVPAILPRHPSHFVLPLQPATGDGSCIIEPELPCTHCHYCKSLGH